MNNGISNVIQVTVFFDKGARKMIFLLFLKQSLYCTFGIYPEEPTFKFFRVKTGYGGGGEF